ncbi:DUF1761 domain-containing protein [Kordiimonas sp.]|uniref:DUF1761 domain-containing protein n=1 Tax=Kordiimonas sp. TaxID=1970157 RepID=UPI003A8F9F60
MEHLGYGLNWLAIVVSATVFMVVGGLWYSPFLAGKAWMKEMGYTAESIKTDGAKPGPAMAKATLASLVASIGLAVLLNMGSLGSLDWLGGALTGFFVSVVVVGGATLPNYAFENRSLRHFLIHIGNTTVAMTFAGAILAAWR